MIQGEFVKPVGFALKLKIVIALGLTLVNNLPGKDQLHKTKTIFCDWDCQTRIAEPILGKQKQMPSG